MRYVRHLNFISMTIIYLLHAVAVESKRFEVTYSRDSLLIKKSSSSSLKKEFLLVRVPSSPFSAPFDGVSWWSIALDGITSVLAMTFVDEDFPNVYSGNCVTKIIDNNKTKFIIAWKHDKYEGKYQNMTFFSSRAPRFVFLIFRVNCGDPKYRKLLKQSTTINIFTWKVYTKSHIELYFFWKVALVRT